MAGSTCSNDGGVVLPAQWLRCPRTPRLQQQRMFAKVANTRACASGSSARSAAVAVPSVRKLSGTSGSGRRQRAASAIHRADERRDEGQGVGAVGTLRGAIDVTILQWPTSSAIHDGPGTCNGSRLGSVHGHPRANRQLRGEPCDPEQERMSHEPMQTERPQQGSNLRPWL